MTPAYVDLVRRPDDEEEERERRRGAVWWWPRGAAGGAPWPWLGRLDALGRAFASTIAGGFEAPQTLIVALAAAAAGAGYLIASTWIDRGDDPGLTRGRLIQDAPVSPPQKMARARGSYAGSLELLSSANRGSAPEDEREDRPPPRPRPPEPMPAPPPRPAPPEAPETPAEEPDPQTLGAAPAGAPDGGSVGRLNGSGGSSSASTFWPLGAPAAGAGGGGSARSGASLGSASAPPKGRAAPAGERTARPVPARSRGALQQLERASALSRFAAASTAEPARFTAGQAFEGAAGSGAAQPITGGGAALGPPVGPEVGGGRPLGAGGGLIRSSSGPSRVVDPTNDPAVDCSLAENQALAACRKIVPTEVRSSADDILSAAWKTFFVVLGLLAASLLLRRAAAPWALGLSRALAAGAALGAAALAALGVWAMTASGGDQGYPWVLAGGALLSAALKLSNGAPAGAETPAELQGLVSEPVDEFAGRATGSLVGP